MADDLAFHVRLRSEQTGGHVALVENTVPPRWAGTPLHHHGFDEAWYVLDGALTLQLGEEVLTAGPGSVTFAPRDSVHAVANHGDVPARYLLVCTPAGFERYFDLRQAELTGVAPPPEADRGFPETHVVGPPIAPRGARLRPVEDAGGRQALGELGRDVGAQLGHDVVG